MDLAMIRQCLPGYTTSWICTKSLFAKAYANDSCVWTTVKTSVFSQGL